MWLRSSALVLLVLVVSLASAEGEDPSAKGTTPLQAVLEALQASEPPALVQAIAAGSEEAQVAAAALAKNPAAVQKISACLLQRQAEIATRDKDGAIALADWIVSLAAAANKSAGKNAAVLAAMWQANLARGRLGLALGKRVRAKHWTTASDFILNAESRKPAPERQDSAYILALTVLHEASRGEKAPLGTLVGHAVRVCRRILKDKPDPEEHEDVIRAVAKSYQWQAELSANSSRKAMQAALGGYFEAFASIAKAEGADGKDQREWNKMVSLFRRAKMDIKVDYIARHCRGAGGALSFDLPRTGHWIGSGSGSFRQVFESGALHRSVEFATYRWDSVYGSKNSPRDVGGDNVKGVAGRNFDIKLTALTENDDGFKIKKKKKPSRKRLNKKLPAGIEYVIEYVNNDGERRRIRGFLLKSVKAELTIGITIYEAAELKGDDPEWLDVIDSFEVTKKKR